MSAPLPAPARLADQDARDLAVSEFQRAVALEAGAGTGKTRALVARLATWLLGPGWALAAEELEARRSVTGGPSAEAIEIAARVAEGAVAITFTDAAAAEMSRRLGELLADLAGGRPAKDLAPLPALLEKIELGEISARAHRLAAVLSRLRLQTIHGFCHRLLADHPFEAGLHPTLTVDAEGEELASAASEVLIERLRMRHPQVTALVQEGVAPAELHQALVQLVGGGARKEAFATDPFDDAACATILESFAARLAAFTRELSPLVATARQVRTLAPALAALTRLEQGLGDGGRDRSGLESLGTLARETQADWQKILVRYAREGLNKTEEKVLGPAGQAYLDRAGAAREALEELLTFDLRRFELARRGLAPLVEQVRFRLDRAGVLTFDDLLARASELLQRNTAVRRSLRREIRQLLVDEFQDTDRRQCELLAALALGDLEGAEGPHGDDGPRPGLFIVGDPKQSIYAWRKADLASYESFLARMQAAGGTSARLSVNFRSVPAVLDEVARAVAPVMIAEGGVQPRFEPLTAGPALAGASGFVSHGRRPVEHWLSWDPIDLARGATTKVARANFLEAAAIAGEIRELHDTADRSWSSFAILLRARKSLEVYLEALRRAGVPYAVQRDRSYYRRREVIDLACAVRAVLDPADLLALVAFLRSPLVGVPDAAWIPLWRCGFASAMAELERPEGLSAAERSIAAAALETPQAIPGLGSLRGWPLALAEAVRTVARLRAEFRSLPTAGWIERLRAWLLPEPLAAARFLGRFGLANVERLLTRLERELDAESDPQRALTRLQRAVDEEKDAEDARPPDVSNDAVAVMTIHTAKGLEYDQVYLAQIHRGNRPDRSGIAEGDSEIVDSPIGQDGRELLLLGAPSPGYLAVDRLRRRSRQAEAVRLLYVALTRARERLVICGNWGAEPRPVEPGRAKNWVELLAERHPGDLLAVGVAPELLDSAGVPWRLAARPTADAKPPGKTTPTKTADLSPLPPSGIAVIASVSTLQRQASRVRANRPRLERVARLAGDDAQPSSPFEGIEGIEAIEAIEASPASLRGTARGPRGDVASRLLAQALGTALHRAMELEALAEHSLGAWRAAAEAVFDNELPGATAGDRALLRRNLERLARSPLLARLRALRPNVLARELPLLAAVETAKAERTASAGTALDGFVGTLDLLYRDPDTAEIVVADFKTDEIPGSSDEAAIAGKLARYRLQLEPYGRAVATVLALDRPPRLEVWLLSVDRIELVRPVALTGGSGSL